MSRPNTARPTEPQRRPNILVIWGDEIGWFNVSAYNQGAMGYRTPHIDRVFREGALFTDWYGQQSCPAGQAAFITGQQAVRTGLTRIGPPASPLGLRPEDPTIAELLAPLGYRAAHFGKSHLGDRDEFLPTAHGFDEFFGNLYHLNEEEEPENPDYPHGAAFRKAFGRRGVLRSWSKGHHHIEDTGPLTRKRMETVDDEFLAAALDFMEQSYKDGRPFFVWWNATRMHAWTHLKPASQGVTGLGVYADGMVEHDLHVGRLLAKLDELAIADNTIVMYSTDTGAELAGWPDGGATPFRGSRASSWEGGWRVPCALRWPGVVRPGTVCNDVFCHTDVLPTLLAAAGMPEAVEKLKNGCLVGERTFRVHLDGFDLLPFLKGRVKQGPRPSFLYWSEDGELMGVRHGPFKVVFLEQRDDTPGAFREPLVPLRSPKLFNLRTDPFERAELTSRLYEKWAADRSFVLLAAQAAVAQFLSTLKDFPLRHGQDHPAAATAGLRALPTDPPVSTPAPTSP
jgi:arylsulfatase A-like enzyme